jgi:hypothetical protein
MQNIQAELRRVGFSRLEVSPWSHMEDQLRIMLPRRIYSLPLIGKYLVGSVNIRAVKDNCAPPSFLSCDGETCSSADTMS